MLSRNRFALKEWESVCSRLAEGRDVLLLRKGGLLEAREGFRVDHSEFFLFPTRFHGLGETPPQQVDLRVYARVEEEFPVSDLPALRRLEGMHALPWEDVERRFHYRGKPGLHALVLRAWTLARPQRIEDARVYDGCRSWVEFQREFDVEAGPPALGDGDFEARRRAVRDALHG
jgi:hypothetical protein